MKNRSMIGHPIRLISLVIIILAISLIGCPPDEPQFCYEQEAVDYFFELAFGSEPVYPLRIVCKWSGEVEVVVVGNYTQEDIRTIDTVMLEVNEITKRQIRLERILETTKRTGRPNIVIRFKPYNLLMEEETDWTPGTLGRLSRIDTTTSFELRYAEVLIAYDVISQSQRNYVIRHELTHSLGLMKHSSAYPESVFNEFATTGVQEYADIDRKVIEIMYMKRISAGMSEDEVRAILFPYICTADVAR